MIDFYEFSCKKVDNVGRTWYTATAQLKKDGCRSHACGPTPEDAIRDAFGGIEKAQKVFDSFK
jgi:hypothetical protein